MHIHRENIKYTLIKRKVLCLIGPRAGGCTHNEFDVTGKQFPVHVSHTFNVSQKTSSHTRLNLQMLPSTFPSGNLFTRTRGPKDTSYSRPGS